MKTITIIQPWATLIAIGEKEFETRSWATKYQGPLAIHAGKKIDKEICEQEPFKSVLAKHGYTVDNLPTGSIIAKAYLKNCYKVTHLTNGTRPGPVWLSAGDLTIGWGGIMHNEYYFGDYSDGRYAWKLENVRKLVEPITAKGQQGFWNWDEK
ncbi:ASCH domain protein [compost metagenome]